MPSTQVGIYMMLTALAIGAGITFLLNYIVKKK